MDWIAFTSIVSSAIVAIASVATPLIYRVVHSSKIRKDRQIAEVDRRAVELLETLGKFGGPAREWDRPEAQVVMSLMGKYYAWERVVWTWADKTTQERVKQIRDEIQKSDIKETQRSEQRWVAVILEVTDTAIKSIK